MPSGIEEIEVRNFKSFKELKVELGRFNVLIGPNASGKSNFVEIFRFLKNLTSYGLENAISIEGGIEYLTNMRIRWSAPFYLKIVCAPEIPSFLPIKDNIGLNFKRVGYEFEVTFRDELSGSKIQISEERVRYWCEAYQIPNKKQLYVGSAEILVDRKGEKIACEIIKKEGEFPLSKEDVIRESYPDEKMRDFTLNKLMLGTPFVAAIILRPAFIFPLMELSNIFEKASIHNLDPRLSRKAMPVSGKMDLEEDGSNLPIVLKHILAKREVKQRFLKLLRDILPFVTDISVEKFADKFLFFKLKEKYFDDYIPASLVSDGTINVISLLIPLYFGKSELIVLEEPDRSIHPAVISKLVNFMDDASTKKQVIITTHNPLIVKYVDIKNLFLVSRGKDGFSKICRAESKEDIKIFLENEIGIEELYVQGLLSEGR